MKFEKVLIEINEINWEKYDNREYKFSTSYYKYSTIACKGLQKIVDLLKKLGYDKKMMPWPHVFRPQDFFIPNEQLFTEQEQEQVNSTVANMRFNQEFGEEILQWAKMCDKCYEITKGNEDLYDELLLALKRCIVTRACCERMLVIGSISAPITFWPEPYYTKCSIAYYDAKIEEIDKEIEEEEKAKWD